MEQFILIALFYNNPVISTLTDDVYCDIKVELKILQESVSSACPTADTNIIRYRSPDTSLTTFNSIQECSHYFFIQILFHSILFKRQN